MLFHWEQAPSKEAEGKDRCSPKFRRSTVSSHNRLVLAEALDIAEKGRVDFDFDGMYRLIGQEAEFEIVGFGPEIFEEALRLKDVKEIHDRIITATAKFYRVGILTKDKIINESGALEPLY